MLTAILIAFLCGLFAHRAGEFSRTVLHRLRRVRFEIDLGSDGMATSEKAIPQSELSDRPAIPSGYLDKPQSRAGAP